MRLKLPMLGILAVLALQAQATEFIATNTYIVAKDQVVAGEQWVLAEASELEGTFKNDLFITSSQPLQFNGTVEGNIWGISGMEANLAGECKRNIRLVGQTIRIDGTIGGNLMALADTIIIGTNAVIGGNIRLIGTSIIQEGLIHGNVHISAARVATLGGTIQGDAKVIASDILFARNAHIGGNLSYTTNKELIPSDGMVAGTLQRLEPKTKPAFSTDRLTTHVMWFFAAFLAGVPFITLFPITTVMAARLVKRSPWKCLIVGFLASGALPMLGIMCISSIIGIPLGTLILAAWGILFYLSRIIIGLVLGTLILRSATSIGRILLAMALGLAIIYLITILPSISVPVQMTVLWLGMGALIMAKLEKRRMIIQAPKNLEQLEKMRDETYNPEEDSP